MKTTNIPKAIGVEEWFPAPAPEIEVIGPIEVTVRHHFEFGMWIQEAAFVPRIRFERKPRKTNGNTEDFSLSSGEERNPLVLGTTQNWAASTEPLNPLACECRMIPEV